MANVCKCCTHPEIVAIDKALLEGNDSLRTIAARFGLKVDSVHRHKAHAEERLRVAELERLGEILRTESDRQEALETRSPPAAVVAARFEAEEAREAARLSTQPPATNPPQEEPPDSPAAEPAVATPAGTNTATTEHDDLRSGAPARPADDPEGAAEDPPSPAPPQKSPPEAVEHVSRPQDPLPAPPSPPAPISTDDDAARELRSAEDRARKTALGMYGVSSTIILTLGKVAGYYKGIADKSPGKIDIKDMIGLARAAASLNTAAVQNLEVAAELERKRKAGPDVHLHHHTHTTTTKSLAEVAESIEQDARLIALAKRRGLNLSAITARTVDAEVVGKGGK